MRQKTKRVFEALGVNMRLYSVNVTISRAFDVIRWVLIDVMSSSDSRMRKHCLLWRLLFQSLVRAFAPSYGMEIVKGRSSLVRGYNDELLLV
jgi:hypothetical protein